MFYLCRAHFFGRQLGPTRNYASFPLPVNGPLWPVSLTSCETSCFFRSRTTSVLTAPASSLLASLKHQRNTRDAHYSYECRPAKFSVPSDAIKTSVSKSPFSKPFSTSSDANRLAGTTFKDEERKGKVAEQGQEKTLFQQAIDSQISEKYAQHLPDWALRRKGPNEASGKMHVLIFLLPVLAGTLAVHLLPSFGYDSLSRDILTLTIQLSSLILCFLAGSHVGLGISNLGVLTRDYRGIWNVARTGCTLLPISISSLAAVFSRTTPHEAIYLLLGGFFCVQALDYFSDIYSLTPRWFFPRRLGLFLTLMPTLLLLLTSESQTLAARGMKLSTM